MIHRIILVVRTELAILKGASPDLSGSRIHVLLQSATSHLGITLSTFDLNVADKTGGEAVLAKNERLLPAQRAGLEVCDTRRTEQATASDTLTRTNAEFSAHGALEVVVHIHFLQLRVHLKKAKIDEY